MKKNRLSHIQIETNDCYPDIKIIIGVMVVIWRLLGMGKGALFVDIEMDLLE